MKTKFKIGILSYNHPELTGRAITACLALVSPEQITLLHNGSELRWVNQLTNQFPKIKHVTLEKNRGFSGGANELLRSVLSEANWCLFLTNDVTLLELNIPKLSGMYAPVIFRRNQDKIDSMGALFNPAQGHLIHCRTEDDFYNRTKNNRPYIPGTAFWLDDYTFSKAGLFDESLGTYWEDVDYSQQVYNKCLPLAIETKTRLIHSVGKTCQKKRFYTSYMFVRNKYYVSLRHNPKGLSRLAFRVSYWNQFIRDYLRLKKMKDSEGLNLKRKILKDLILGIDRI